MTDYGWRGQNIRKDARSPYVKELEEGDPETVLARKRWQRVAKAQRESRFSDGPVFKKLNQPKKTFFQRHSQKFMGFTLIGTAFFFFAYPMYGLFIEPLLPKKTYFTKEKLGNEDPQAVLDRVICQEYYQKNDVSLFKGQYDAENPKYWKKNENQQVMASK